MAPTLLAPNVDNYIVGKGICSFKPTGAANWIDIGNVTELEFTPKVETLEHFSSRQGVRTKDKTVLLTKSGELRMVMEEFNAQNLAMLLSGDINMTDPTHPVVNIFSQSSISGEFRFTATNDVGPQWDFYYPRVDFLPSGSLSPISAEWGTMEVTGQVSIVGTNFGTATLMNLDGVLGLPTNLTLPSISGTVREGFVLTAGEGSWARNPTSFLYQWQKSGVDISLATAKTYTPVTGDVGSPLRVGVKGVNATGPAAAFAYSAPTVNVVAA